MKKIILSLSSAFLLTFTVNSCSQENEDLDNTTSKVDLIKSKVKDFEKNRNNYEQRQSDSLRTEKTELSAEKEIIETVDPDKIKPPQH